MIDRNDLIITGCNAGMCRSQATAGFLRKHGVVVDHVIAGRDSAINYTKKNKLAKTQSLNAIELFNYSIMMWNAKRFVKSYQKNKCAIFCGKLHTY